MIFEVENSLCTNDKMILGKGYSDGDGDVNGNGYGDGNGYGSSYGSGNGYGLSTLISLKKIIVTQPSLDLLLL